jgi:hypothetical protein
VYGIRTPFCPIYLRSILILSFYIRLSHHFILRNYQCTLVRYQSWQISCTWQHSELVRTSQPWRTWQPVYFLKLRGQVRHLRGGGPNTIFWFDFIGRGHLVSWRWWESVLHGEWTELHHLQCEQNGHLTDWRRTFALMQQGVSWIAESVSKASSTAVNWVTNKGGHKYACSLPVKTGEKRTGLSLFRRNRNWKRANYTANSALHTLLKLSPEDGDERTTYRTSTSVYEGEHNVTSSPTATTRNYAFLLQYPIVAVEALTRMALNAATYNKHPTTNVSRKRNIHIRTEWNKRSIQNKLGSWTGRISKATSDTYSYKITPTFSLEAIYNRYQVQMDQILNKKYRRYSTCSLRVHSS